MIGQTISHYHITEKLGEGGMGVVYKALDTNLDRHVALKFLPESATPSKKDKQRFIREAKSAASLNHPKICTIHNIDEHEGRQFIVMEYIEGETLREKIDSAEEITLEVFRDYSIQITEALVAAHSNNIIHRDIKPKNIMVDEEGGIKVTDFGLAKLKHGKQITQTGDTVGTLAYCSPEQVKGENVDLRSDIFSLGIVLYEMLAGTTPFQGMHRAALTYAIVNEDPAPLRDHRPDAPKQLVQIIERCLAKKPEERYQSAQTLLADLKKDEGSSKLIDPSFTPDSGWSITSFQHSRLLAGAAAILAVLAVATWALWPRQSAAFQEGDRLVLADFRNETSDSIFTGSLSSAFRISLEQSPYLNVYPEKKVNETLKQMRLGPDTTRLSGSLAREIAEREGVSVAVAPSISKVGTGYILGFSVYSAGDPGAIGTESIRVDDRDDVLSALDELSERLRKFLGESDDKINRFNKSLANVTTGSLEALKLFSRGQDRLGRQDFKGARRLMSHALEVDSNFTTARAALGALEIDLFNREKGVKMLKQVIKNTDDLTHLESFIIRAMHADYVEHDLEKAAGLYRTLIELYPNKEEPYHNLGFVLKRMGNYKEAANRYKEANEINPSNLTFAMINDIYLYSTGRVDSALANTRRWLKQDSTSSSLWNDLGWIYLAVDSLDAAESAFQRTVKLNPENITAQFRIGHTHRMAKNYDSAADAFQQILGIDSSKVGAHYMTGDVRRRQSRQKAAKRHFHQHLEAQRKQIKEYPDWPYFYVHFGRSLARLGQHAKAEEARQKALANSDSTADIRFSLALLDGALGKNDRAFQNIKSAIDKGYQNYIWIKIHPDLTELSKQQRFNHLMDSLLHKPEKMHRIPPE